MVRPRRVLIVEDEDIHAQVMEWAFQRPPAWEVARVADGAEALDFLFRQGRHLDAWLPDLIVLNLRLPKLCGLEVLPRIKAEPRLAPIPVVIWSVSTSPENISRAYQNGAAIYLTKPARAREARRQALWLRRLFDWAQLPTPGAPTQHDWFPRST
ncbi:response regulator [Candidatus Bipolaricaulota bacterium]|nr:response regulator [Candidatus Bipolaricaulota bacterium]